MLNRLPNPEPMSRMESVPCPHLARGNHNGISQEIGLRIVRGDHPPGSILPNEAQWAEMFHASRSVVREALKMLTAKGLIASKPKVGSRVEPRQRWNLLDRDVLAWYAAGPDQTFMQMVQELRKMIEPEASAFAAARRSAEEADAITRACRDMACARNVSDRIAADARFHLSILAASGNDLLVPLGPTIEIALNQFIGKITRMDDGIRENQEMHDAIERAIRLRRPEAARRASRMLLQSTDVFIQREASMAEARA